MRDTGAPSTDPAAKLNRGESEDNTENNSDDNCDVSGDLDSPHVKEYPGCKSNSWECRGVKDD